MARTIGEVGLATELWTPAIQQRFELLFDVASRKSLAGWRQVPRGNAEVLVMDGNLPVPETEAKMPCVVYVGGEPAMQPLGRSARGWAAHLDEDFTLYDLIDMLDRAAVFLMDWKARTQTSAILTLQRAMQDLLRMGEECPHQFQIKSWVVLPGSVNSAQNMRVLALLARGPISARTLCEHSGIDIGPLQQLLAQAAVQAVLRCSLQSTEAPKPIHEIKTQPAAVSRGWAKKLTGWITRGGRA